MTSSFSDYTTCASQTWDSTYDLRDRGTFADWSDATRTYAAAGYVLTVDKKHWRQLLKRDA